MRLEGKLEIWVRTALSVGSGGAPPGMGIDKAAVRDHEGRLVIPASSIKGTVRSECERILRGIDPDLVCCPPRAEQMCPHFELPSEREKPIYQREGCPCCRLFGTNGRKAGLLFSDAWQESTMKLKGVDSQVRPGVSLSRRRRTAEDERLYFVETSIPRAGFCFAGKIMGEVGARREVALLLAGIRSVVALGGGRSRGLGWIGTNLDDDEEEVCLDGSRVMVRELLGHIGEWRP